MLNGNTAHPPGVYTLSPNVMPGSLSASVFPQTQTLTSAGVLPSPFTLSVPGLPAGTNVTAFYYDLAATGNAGLTFSGTVVSAPPSPVSSPCSSAFSPTAGAGLGVDGAPVPCDYWHGSKLFQGNIAPLLTKLLLFLFGSIFVQWVGIKVGKSLIHKFGLGYGGH